MNKKGFLLGEETLKIIISAICIIFLVYLATMLYFAHVNKEKPIQAESILNSGSEGSIKTAIEKVENKKGSLLDGDGELRLLNSPVKWYVFSFAESEKPNLCLGESCICICDKTYISNQIKSCDKSGSCLKVNNLNSFKEIEINSNPITTILIKKENNKISIEEIK